MVETVFHGELKWNGFGLLEERYEVVWMCDRVERRLYDGEGGRFWWYSGG